MAAPEAVKMTSGRLGESERLVGLIHFTIWMASSIGEVAVVPEKFLRNSAWQCLNAVSKTSSRAVRGIIPEV
jgi:hypothetical protein